ncbi:MAG: hypothetical protein Q4C70_09525 [Planctomycetia bacterium]|nr:hypothetical protein [Planctomycetia bacterium]
MGWKTSETSKIEQYPNFYRVEFSEKDSVNISLTPDSSGIYRTLNNFPETLTINTSTNTYTIVRKNGTIWDFSGFIPSSGLAVLQRVQNEEGKQMLFFYDSVGRLLKVQQLSEALQVVSEMEYEYDLILTENVSRINVRSIDRGTLQNQKSIAYIYYQDGENFGNIGDLKIVQSAIWSELESKWKDTTAEYYRYYTHSGAFGKQHQLRMKFNAVDFAFLKEKFGEQWQFVNDDKALDYCTQYFEYNAQNRVALTRKNRNRLTYRYEYTNYSENSDYNAVTRKTVEYGAHGEQTIVFTNFNEDVLLKEIKSPEIQEEQ